LFQSVPLLSAAGRFDGLCSEQLSPTRIVCQVKDNRVFNSMHHIFMFLLRKNEKILGYCSLLYFLEQDNDKNAATGQNSGGRMENSFIQSLFLHSYTNVQQQHQQQQSKVQPAEDNFYEEIEIQSYEIEQSTERPKATIINYSTIKPYHQERSYPKQQQQF
jgi:hypothetical protein